MKKALLSVYEKTEIIDFARFLIDHNYELYASEGTAKHLAGAGLRVVNVAEIVGFPPILDHRVATLSEKIFGGLLAMNNDDHRKQLLDHDIPWFDLVYVGFYPVKKAIDTKNASVKSIMNMTDIGGPAIIRACAKGHTDDRIVICNKKGEELVRKHMNKTGNMSKQNRLSLAAIAFQTCSDYDKVISNFLSLNPGGFAGDQKKKERNGAVEHKRNNRINPDREQNKN